MGEEAGVSYGRGGWSKLWGEEAGVSYGKGGWSKLWERRLE